MSLFHRDLKYHFLKNKYGYLAFTVLILMFFFFYLSTLQHSNINPIDFLLYSLIHDSGEVSGAQGFFVPIGWFLLHIIPVFSNSQVLYQDHVENGIYILPKAKSKTHYLVSKIGSALVIQLGFFAIFFGGLSILFYLTYGTMGDSYQVFFRVSMSYFVENFLFTFIVFTIAIYSSYRIGVMLFFALLTTAMLLNFPFILGQGSLVMRQDFSGGKMNLPEVYLVYLLYFAVFSVVNVLKIRKLELLGVNNA